jgi:hypothetical protein
MSVTRTVGAYATVHRYRAQVVSEARMVLPPMCYKNYPALVAQGLYDMTLARQSLRGLSSLRSRIFLWAHAGHGRRRL